MFKEDQNLNLEDMYNWFCWRIRSFPETYARDAFVEAGPEARKHICKRLGARFEDENGK